MVLRLAASVRGAVTLGFGAPPLVGGASPSGRGAPGGGIIPARILRIAFSACSASCSGCARSSLVQEKPPDLTLSLWQPRQYWLISVRGVDCAVRIGAVSNATQENSSQLAAA